MTKNISIEMKRFNYLISEIDSVYHEAALKLGLSDSAMSILYAICDNGEGCLLQEICFYTGISKQTINSALRKLEKEGIVYLELLNAKSKKVYLTDKGRELAEKTAFRVLQMEDESYEKYRELTESYLVHLKEKINEL